MLTETLEPPAQYDALVQTAGVVPLPDRTQIELTGGDRAKYLHNLCTNDVARLQPGEGCEAFFTNVQGKTIGHGYIFCHPDRLIIDTVPGQAETLLPHFDRYHITEKVELHDRSDARAELLVAGKGAEKLLSQWIEDDLPAERLAHVDATLGEHAVSLRRVDLTGPTALLLSLDRHAAEAVCSMLAAAGAAACGQEAFAMARVEFGTPLYGQDISDKNLPQEVARDKLAISFTKGCYLGQETVARIDALGHVNRTLCGLRFAGPQIPASGTELSSQGKTVGHVTSAAFSPRLDAPLALGYVRREHSSAGTPLDSASGEATIVDLPVT